MDGGGILCMDTVPRDQRGTSTPPDWAVSYQRGDLVDHDNPLPRPPIKREEEEDDDADRKEPDYTMQTYERAREAAYAATRGSDAIRQLAAFLVEFVRVLARPDGVERAERMCASIRGTLCDTPWPSLAEAFDGAFEFFMGPRSGDVPRAITPRQAILWVRLRRARDLFDAGQFGALERYCDSSPEARALCSARGLGWGGAYARQFDPSASAYFGPNGLLPDTLESVLAWRRQHEEFQRRALYGLLLAYHVWLRDVGALPVGAEENGRTPEALALALIDAPTIQLETRLRGLLGATRATDVVPLGASPAPPARAVPVPVLTAPIDSWTPETVADGSALADVPGGVSALFAAVRTAVADAESWGIERAVADSGANAREAISNAYAGTGTPAEADRATRIAGQIASLGAVRREARLEGRQGALADIGTSFPGTGVYLMRVSLGNGDSVPALGVIPAAAHALSPVACSTCTSRLALGLEPVVGAHRH